MDNDRCIITNEQALDILADGEQVHTFRGGNGFMLGGNWDREDLIEAIRESERVEIGGAACQSLGHGLVVWTGDTPLFVECKKGTDYAALADPTLEG